MFCAGTVWEASGRLKESPNGKSANAFSLSPVTQNSAKKLDSNAKVCYHIRWTRGALPLRAECTGSRRKGLVKTL